MVSRRDHSEVFEPSAEFFARLPVEPGVYLMKDAADNVIYVGKAINLRNRVRQYFRPGDDPRFFVVTGLLGRNLAGIETIIVENEKEALLLENHLIKVHKPRFNVKLRDDKQYLVLRIDPRSKYPRVEVVRNIKDDGARYFGPYHSATSCRQTLRTLNRHFKLRTCSDHVLETRKRTCLQYQIRRCPGPCVIDVEIAEYSEQVEDVILFLSGKDQELLPRLRRRMQGKSEKEEFEAAAALRDSIRAVEMALSRQDVVQEEMVDQDVFGMWRDHDVVELVVLFIRSGKLVGHRGFRANDQEFADSQVLSNFVQQYYATGTYIPGQVLVPQAIDDDELICAWLSEKRGKKVRILTPQRGQRVRLVELANKNAASTGASREGRKADREAALHKLQQRLRLRRFPHRIECIDIAHIQGEQTVASLVVFVDGEPANALYRKFVIKGATNDDYAAMREVVGRRFRRALNSSDHAWKMPDLLVVDGGKGQLGVALAALNDVGVDVTEDEGCDVISLAKERQDSEGIDHPDRVFLRNSKDAIRLRANTTELFLLAQLRDEAHRFANTFHRRRRTKSALRSALDDIPGIGPVRRKRLLTHFGSVKAIRAATVDAIASVQGMNRSAAEMVKQHLDRR